MSITLIAGSLNAQNAMLAKEITGELCAKKFHGRGYYKRGAVKASAYIARQFKRAGAQTYTGSYFQRFPLTVNAFPGTVSLRVNGKTLIPGRDFVVSPDAPRSTENFPGRDIKSMYFLYPPDLQRFAKDTSFRRIWLDSISRARHKAGLVLVIVDTMPPNLRRNLSPFFQGLKSISHTIFLTNDKFTWSVADQQSRFVSLEVRRECIIPQILPDYPYLSIQWVNQARITTSEQRNVIGYIPGTRRPDSFLLFTAHYDHLGQMGKNAIFPGANDNAVGVAMLVDLIQYYTRHPPEYSMLFMAFAAEEAGLVGSYQYVAHSVHPLAVTRFVLNLDLVGTGETGMTVVNAAVFNKDFQLLKSLHKDTSFEIRSRGKAANSDHYFFTEAGIPSFFWYQSGPRNAYHDIDDVPETLTFSGYDITFRLAVSFYQALMHEK